MVLVSRLAGDELMPAMSTDSLKRAHLAEPASERSVLRSKPVGEGGLGLGLGITRGDELFDALAGVLRRRRTSATNESAKSAAITATAIPTATGELHELPSEPSGLLTASCGAV